MTDKKYVDGEKFTRAWINRNSLPGGMMHSSDVGKFGPVAASTSVWITTSDKEASRLRLEGEEVLEVFTKDAQRYEILKEAGEALLDASHFEAYDVIYKMMEEAQKEKAPNKEREQLEMIVRSDPSLILRHLEENTNYDAKAVAKIFELAKERASEILKQTKGT